LPVAFAVGPLMVILFITVFVCSNVRPEMAQFEMVIICTLVAVTNFDDDVFLDRQNWHTVMSLSETILIFQIQCKLLYK